MAWLTVMLFGVLTLWATLTPPFATVDEPRHANSVLRLVQGGGWPPPREAVMLEASAVAAEEAERGVPRADRSAVLTLSEPESPTPRRDWMNQHPPLYYGISAAAVVTADTLSPGDQRWDTSLLVMRMVSVLLTAASVPFVARSVHLVTGSTPAALVGAGVFLLVPQLANTHSLVTNDAMVTFLGSVLMFVCLRAFMRPETLLSSSVIGGVTLGVGLLTKGLMLPAVAVLAVFLLLAGRRAGPGWVPRFWTPLLGGVVAFVVGGWWWLRNILVFGQVQSSNNQTPRAAEPFDDYSPAGFAIAVVARLNRTFWASIRPQAAYDGSVVVAMGLLGLVVVMTALVLSRRRGVLLLTLIYPALVATLFTVNAFRIYWNSGVVAGVQGRYLYSGLTFLALALALVWVEVRRRGGRITGLVLATTVAVACTASVVGAYLFAFHVRWVGGDGLASAYEAMVRAGPLQPWQHLIVVALTAVAAVVTLVTILRACADDNPLDDETVARSSSETAVSRRGAG
ncbi:hypothetical protein GCM10009821_14290 [Aeromicrobium halocynthiae]|uniref:ArnT-like N-terminal domain-containing protein n=1 Tax=Aeromicrobium halocynthiae TaxID=560557 RepID=A0ABN2VXA0_9ACTN